MNKQRIVLEVVVDQNIRTRLLSSLGTWILVAMFLGIAAGSILGEEAALLAPLGQLFLKLIKMLVIPLVFFSILAGAASLGQSSKAGRFGLLTFGYYLGTTIIAVSLGLFLGNRFNPAGFGKPCLPCFRKTRSRHLQKEISSKS